eukprot:4924515-Prymnesium_polylepis.1
MAGAEHAGLIIAWLPAVGSDEELFRCSHADGDDEDLNEDEAREARARYVFSSLRADAEAAAAAAAEAQVATAASALTLWTGAADAASVMAEDALVGTLRSTLGHDNFRGDQREVVEALLQGRDALVVWPTDRGKSLCYQLPALHRRAENMVVAVISPLIVLMNDQGAQLNRAAAAHGEAPWAAMLHHLNEDTDRLEARAFD